MADTLKRAKNTVTDANGEVLLDGASGHTYTIIAITLCNTHASNDETFSIAIADHGSSAGSFSNPDYIYDTQSLPAHATFEHTSKIVLEGTDELWVMSPSASATIDVVVSYLDQD